jgi:murein L,D-transpeptidase YafK
MWKRHSLSWLFALLACAGLLLAAGKGGGRLPQGTRIDRIVVKKSARQLITFAKGQVVKVYRVALGGCPVGPKERAGDHRTPEGLFVIDSRNAQSAYHLSLHVSYPGPGDLARARAGGYDPGGAIMIHGLPRGLGWLGPSHRLHDWTDGCIAVTDGEIEELWRTVPDGTPIEILP